MEGAICVYCGASMKRDEDGQSLVCSTHPFCTYRIYEFEFPRRIAEATEEGMNTCYNCFDKFIPVSSSDTHCLKCKLEIRRKYNSEKRRVILRSVYFLEAEKNQVRMERCLGVFEDGKNINGEECKNEINTFFRKKRCDKCKAAYQNYKVRKRRKQKKEKEGREEHFSEIIFVAGGIV